MTKLFTAPPMLLIAFCLGIRCLGFAQQQVISTKRDSPIGLVTFGPTVISGVLGERVYIDGYIKKKGSNLFLFPVGDNGAYRPFAAAADQTYGAYFQADPSVGITSDPLGGDYGVLPQGGPFNVTSLDKSLGAVSDQEYWDINGAGSTQITLTWDQQSSLPRWLAGGDLSKLTIAGWNGTSWEKIPSTIDAESLLGEASTVSSGSITSTLALSPDSYNVYTLGMQASGALPVTLLTFKATAIEQNAYLEWSTTQEINSSHFDIETSSDTRSWTKIGRIDCLPATFQTASEYRFTDTQKRSGINYYRLKMVDLDAAFTYSPITNLDFASDLLLTLYPNPVSEKILFKGLDAGQLQSARLVNQQGVMLRSQSDLKDGFLLDQITSGTYILMLAFKNGAQSTQKIVVVQ